MGTSTYRMIADAARRDPDVDLHVLVRFVLDAYTSVKPVPYYVKALALGVPALLIILECALWLNRLPSVLAGNADFRHEYVAGYMLRAGQRPLLYDYPSQITLQNTLVSPGPPLPFNHLAYEALLFAPLSFLSYRSAWLAFLVSNLLLLVLSYLMLRPSLSGLAQIHKRLPAAIFVSFLPVGTALRQGQDSVVLLFLASAAASCLFSGRELSAGMVLGLGCFKFHLVIPIALLFVFCRRWRFSAGFAISAAFCLAVSFWVVAPGQFHQYVRMVFSAAMQTGSDCSIICPLAMPNLRGLISGIFGSSLSPYSLALITLASSAILLAWATVKLRQQEYDQRRAISIALIAAFAVSYHAYPYDLTVLLIPILFALDGAVSAEYRRWLVFAAVVMFVSPALPIHPWLGSLAVLGLLVATSSFTRDKMALAVAAPTAMTRGE